MPPWALASVPETMLLAFRFVNDEPLPFNAPVTDKLPGTLTDSLALPRTIVLFVVTVAPTPIAVESCTPAAPLLDTPIKVLLRLALDAGPGILYKLHLDLASLSIAEFYPDGASSVRLVNQTGYL